MIKIVLTKVNEVNDLYREVFEEGKMAGNAWGIWVDCGTF